MSFVRPKFAFILILMAGLCLPISSSAQAADATKKVSHHSGKPKAAKAAKKVEEHPPTPAPPPPPPTPEQMPSQPPTVTYQNGQLAIVAPNSSLSDILQAVHNKTGANIDIPPGANERVVSTFGPGPARDVLTSLLNGSHFNYVMVGTEADPTAVAQVILTPRTGGETPPTPAQASQPGGPMRAGMPQQQFPQSRPQPQMQGQAQAPEEPAASDGMEEEDTSQDNNIDNSNDQGAPEQVQGSEGQGQNPNQPVVKTPEQLLLELQRQQQTMQQQQQQGQQPQAPVSVSPNPQQPPQQQPKPQ
jgi:hypothetical protein